MRQIGTILKTIVIRITDMVARYVTVSLGVITVYPQRLEAPEQVVALADEALYSAKKGGRNRTEVALDKTLFLLYGIK